MRCLTPYLAKRATKALLQKCVPSSLVIAQGVPNQQNMFFFRNFSTTLLSLVGVVYVAHTRVRVSDTGTCLRIGFDNFQNLEYEDTNDKYPNFGYDYKGVFDKNKEIVYKSYTFI